MKRLLFLGLLLFLFTAFADSLHYYFISDDFFYISFQKLSDVLSFKKIFYHYNPVFWFALYLMRKFLNTNPYFYHLIAIVLHLINAVLVFFIYRILFKYKNFGIVASCLFGVFFGSYEVVYWITGINTSLMVFFYLISLILFNKYLLKPNFINYIAFLGVLLLSVLSHEYGISVIFICILYYHFFFNKSQNVKSLFKLFLLPVIFVILLFIMKVVFSTPITVQTPTFSRFAASFIKSFTYLLYPFPTLIDSLPKIVIILLFILAILFLLLASFQSKRLLFLALWVTISVLFYSFTSLPQARYFYLSYIPVSLLISSILQNISNSIHKKHYFLLKSILINIILVFYLLPQIIFLADQKLYWRKSSAISKNVAVDLHTLLNQKNFKKIYLINVPDSSNNSIWKAYLFRNGLEIQVANILGYKPEVEFIRLSPFSANVRDDPIKSLDELIKQKDEGILFLIFDEYQNKFVKY